MVVSTALSVVLALSAGSSEERLLLCRPIVLGDPALARADAVPEAGRQLAPRFLDYGVPCQDAGEGARAARRAGLERAVVATAEGGNDGSHFSLVLTESGSDAVRARRSLLVEPGKDPARPVKSALNELIRTLPEPPGPKPGHVAAYVVTGTGVAAMVLGMVFSSQASAADRRAARADDPAAYTRARAQAADRRQASSLSFVLGGAAVVGGLTWRFVF